MKFLLAYGAVIIGTAMNLLAGSVEDVATRNAQLADSKALKALVADQEKPALWLFIGDSITQGFLHTACQRNYVEHFTEMIKWEHAGESARMADIIINAGVGGETATGFLRAADFRLKAFNPSVVFVMFGVNDNRRGWSVEQFKANMLKIISMSREKGAIPVLQVPTLVAKHRPDEVKYYQAVRDLADEENCLLVDHASRWNENNEARELWLSDGLHPNKSGHLIMAQTIVRSLDIAPKKSTTLSLAENATMKESFMHKLWQHPVRIIARVDSILTDKANLVWGAVSIALLVMLGLLLSKLILKPRLDLRDLMHKNMRLENELSKTQVKEDQHS